jgi:hypothetical protein
MDVKETSSSFNPDSPLRSATVQDLQLELIRRTQRNALDGEKIVHSLMKHRALWSAVLLDRQYVYDRSAYDLPLGGMIKLRDLPKNYWNADTLYILCHSPEAGTRLVEIAEKWGSEAVLWDQNKEEFCRSLGSWHDDNYIVRVWWD